MIRRNPDALALAAIGLFFMALNVPRVLVQQANWNVTPIKAAGIQTRTEMDGQRRMIRERVEEIRDSIRREGFDEHGRRPN